MEIITLDYAFAVWEYKFPHRQMDFGIFCDYIKALGIIIY